MAQAVFPPPPPPKKKPLPKRSKTIPKHTFILVKRLCPGTLWRRKQKQTPLILMEKDICKGVLGWGRCLCLEANMDTDGLPFPDYLPPLAGPHVAGMETTGDL